MFIFAIYSIQIIGGQLARCNDRTLYNEQVSLSCKVFIDWKEYQFLAIMSWNILEKTLRIKNECQWSGSSDVSTTCMVSD